MKHKECHIIRLQTVGEIVEGYISIAEQTKNIPFDIRRVFYTYGTPVDVARGGHAHHLTEMALFAIQGQVVLHTESATGRRETWELKARDSGVFIPAYTWHTMEYSEDAIQLVFASTLYSASDYIRDYEEYKSILSSGKLTRL